MNSVAKVYFSSEGYVKLFLRNSLLLKQEENNFWNSKYLILHSTLVMIKTLLLIKFFNHKLGTNPKPYE